MIKKILLVSILILVAYLCWYRHLVRYGWMQAKGQLEILWNARPVNDLYDDTNLADSLRSKLQLIEDIKSFADSLGLEVGNSYTKVYDQKGKAILWNLSACEPFAFKSFTWTFPILGTFSYKGFFDLDEAKAEAKLLKDKGLDTRIRSVGAWSTLGWFDDPLLSNQLFRSEGDLAEMIFHELTHATIFYQDSVTFNENLASFVGKKATVAFLTQHFGDSSKEKIDYLMSEKDAILFRNHFLEGKDLLDSLYQSFTPDLTDSTKNQLKEMAIKSII